MKFHIWRFIGILFSGVMLFFFAVMQQNPYYWNSFFADLQHPDYRYILWGFIIGLIGAAIFLSIEGNIIGTKNEE